MSSVLFETLAVFDPGRYNHETKWNKKMKLMFSFQSHFSLNKHN